MKFEDGLCLGFSPCACPPGSGYRRFAHGRNISICPVSPEFPVFSKTHIMGKECSIVYDSVGLKKNEATRKTGGIKRDRVSSLILYSLFFLFCVA
jgi:hypothetical protein